MDRIENKAEVLRPDIDQIRSDLSAWIRDAITSDPLINRDPEIFAARAELLQLLTNPSNLQFGILKNEWGVLTTETGRYFAALAVKKVPRSMLVLPNCITGECSFDHLFERLGPDRYRKLIEFECLEVLAKIQKRQAAAEASAAASDDRYHMTMPGGPSGTYRGGEWAQELGITSFSQADIDRRYAKRARWLLARLADGESAFSVVQPFKKIRSS